ncbi:MAG: trypsin-like serine protease [Candidatus Staskawiczbacteria bacterium]|nr:trypsin-like serine protease [Candidatus Staskawiczbacteria bacterium]
MYDLPKFNKKNSINSIKKIVGGKIFRVFFLIVILLVAVLFYLQMFSTGFLHDKLNDIVKKIENNFSITKINPPELSVVEDKKYVSQNSYEQAIIDAVASASPSVVSIVISKNVPVYEKGFINPFGDLPNNGLGSPFIFKIPQQVQKGTKYQEVGAGSGFIVSSSGLVLTNKHVVSDKIADYTVFTSDGKKYPAKVVALDPVQDLAIIKIQDPLVNSDQAIKFPSIKIGNSDGIQIGQGAIAIGNALGEFSNTVSVGVVSGLGRTVTASVKQGFSEKLEDIIQTDAAINLGNSGGPLINLKGEVIGVNTATADGAQSIGFAIPINIAKRDIDQIIATNKIVYPFLGVRYVLIDDYVKEKYALSVDYGAYVLKGDNGEAAVTKDSAAQKAGIKEKDVVLEIDGQKITKSNSLAKMIAICNPKDIVILKVLRDGKEITIEAVLGER